MEGLIILSLEKAMAGSNDSGPTGSSQNHTNNPGLFQVIYPYHKLTLGATKSSAALRSAWAPHCQEHLPTIPK